MRILLTCLLVCSLTNVFAQTAIIDTKDNVIVIQPSPAPATQMTIDRCTPILNGLNKGLAKAQAQVTIVTNQITFWTNTCQQATDAGLQPAKSKH